MLNSIKFIGDYVKENNININDILTNNSTEQRQIVFFVSASSSNPEKFSIEIEDYDVLKLDKYPGEQEYPKGNVALPFSPVSEFRKTLEKRVVSWFKSFLKEVTDFELANVLYSFVSKIDEIASLLEEKAKELSLKKDVTKFLGIKIDGKYFGEYPKLYDYWLQKKEAQKWYDGYCGVCGNRTNVTLRTKAFKFDSLDKPGYIAGGFDLNKAWKNIPVCAMCRESLQAGKLFIEKTLNFRFYGLNYWLIPKFLFEDKQTAYEVLDILSDDTKVKNIKISLLKKYISDENQIVSLLDETRSTDELPSHLSNDLKENLLLFLNPDHSFSKRVLKDSLSLNFLFIQKEQSAEKILLQIEDVLPSRMRQIYEAKEYTENFFRELLRNVDDSGEIWENYPRYFTFGKVRTFFSKTDPDKRTRDLDNYFLSIVNSVFRGKVLNWNFLTNFYMKQISYSFIHEKVQKGDNDGGNVSGGQKTKLVRFFPYVVLDAMYTTTFLDKLNLIKFKVEGVMSESIFDELFEKFGRSFESPAKRGIFLLGALTQMLLNLQRQRLNNFPPFMKKLKALKMREEDFRALLPEVQNKFLEYDSYGIRKRKLAEEISQFLLESGSNWKMSVDEMNYYFACGMNLAEKIKQILEKHYPQHKEDE